MDQVEQAGDANSAFASLMHRARAGDQSAISDLVDRHRGYLLLIANAELDHRLRSKLGASDVVQDTMLAAQLNFAQFRGQGEMEWQAWLRAILQNDLRQTRRAFKTQKRNSRQETELNDRSISAAQFEDANPTPSAEALLREKAELLHSSLARLSRDQQTVIQLRNFEQLDFQEIGNRMSRSSDAARKLWARAIRTLTQTIHQHAPELNSSVTNRPDSDG